MLGGVLAVGGDLVFFGRSQGVRALNAETGELLWQVQAKKGPLGPPISVQAGDHQRTA